MKASMLAIVMAGVSALAAPLTAAAQQASAPAPVAGLTIQKPLEQEQFELLEKTKQGKLTNDEVIRIEELLGPDQWRAGKVDNSPRLHKDVTLVRDGRELGALVVYPNLTTGKVPVVMFLPEDQGVNRWARDMADRIAALGYIVIVPDFMHGLAPNGGGGSSFPDTHSVFQTQRARPKQDQLWALDLNAWADYAVKLPGANGKIAAAGFGWGGGRAAWFATVRKDLSALFVFYDAIPADAPVEKINAAVYGFYAEYDPRVIRQLDSIKARMAAAGKKYESVVYPGAEHMFVRIGEEPRNILPANTYAYHDSMARFQMLLAKTFEGK